MILQPAVAGSSGSNGSSYGGGIFNYSGHYLFSNVTYGSGANANSAIDSSDRYIYSGSSLSPFASILPVTNLTGTTATINGSVSTNNISTTYRFIYGTNPSSLSNTLASQNAGSSGTVNVSANLTGLTSGTFYYFKLITSNTYGTDTSSTGSFVYDNSISKTNLKLWLASDGGVETSGGKVSEWYDKSGNSNSATQSTSSNEPSYTSSAINSKPALSFDGPATYLTLPTATSLGIQNSDYEMFIVAKSSSTNLQFVEGGTPGNYELQLNGGLGARFIPSGSNYLDEGSSNAYTNGQAHIFDLKATSTKGIIRIDGVAGGYVLSNTQSADGGNLNIGRRSNGSYYFSGDVAEVIIYNTSLTSSQRLTIGNYLSQKYNTTYTTVSKPTVQASNMTFSNITSNSITLNVTKGDGSYRLILAKSGSAVDASPTDGQVYTANSSFGSGTQIGNGNYVVYAGSGSGVTVTGLSSHTGYYFSTFEYNGTNTDQSYLTTSPATGNSTTLYPPPILTILPDSAKTSSSVYFRGIVNPNGTAATYKFIYGTSLNSLTNSTAVVSAGSNNTNDTVRAQITGITNGTFYYHALVATNSGGTDTSTIGAVAFDNSIPSTNLKMWLRSDEGTSSSTDNTNISTWYDVTGNLNNATQTTSANQPLIRTNVINGHPVMRFNGSTSYFNLPSTGTLGIQNSDYEIFIVAKTSFTGVEFLISAAGYQYEMQFNGTNIGMRFIPPIPGGGYLDEGTTNEYADGNPHIFSVRASSTGGAARVDGVDGGTTTADLQNANDVSYTLGTRYGPTLPFNGDIAEVIVYNTILSASQLNTVESYLSQKYNINSGALPIELSTFTAADDNDNVELNWKTETEVNNYGFEIQRAVINSVQNDTSNWKKIGFIKGTGNSNSPKKYSYTDQDISGGISFEYRLKQIDGDGKYKYSKVIEITLAPKQFELYQNYPNPFNPTTKIKYSLASSSKVTLRIYNLLGQQIKQLVNENETAGHHEVTFDGSNLSSGIYFYRITAGQHTMSKKMILTK